MQITTAAQAAQRDANAIASGIDSWTLMLAAGSAAATLIAGAYSHRLAHGATVYAGRGNNGGDAYVIAARLVESGVRVVLRAVGEPRTADAKRARDYYGLALAQRAKVNGGNIDAGAPDIVSSTANGVTREQCELIVDGLLGTGQRGELREPERAACVEINSRGALATVVALDVPTGVNATTGECAQDAVQAHYTIAFGTMKRAHVLRRQQMGTISVVDIGLGSFAHVDDGAWTLADVELVRGALPRIEWNAYKGTRGKLAIVGGADGMAGAIVLSTRAALRAGAGLVYAHTSPASVHPLQIAVPQVVARTWNELPQNVSAVGIGPGFGRDDKSQQTLRAMLDATVGVPTVLDADALTLLATHSESVNDDLDEVLGNQTDATTTIARLQRVSSTRPVVCTPHVGEFARLINAKVADSIEGRIAQAMQFANAAGAVILLKGTPTVVVSPNDVSPTVIPRGTAVLATGGSGDLLTGLIGALLGQGASPRDAAVIGAWVHGRAAEIATVHAGTVRGVTLDEVLASLVIVWRELQHAVAPQRALLAELPAL